MTPPTKSLHNRASLLELPELLEIEITRGCNLRCIMCHISHMKDKVQFLDLDALDRHTQAVRDCRVIIGSYYEPTIHPEFERLLRIAIDRGWKIDFLTNGTTLHRYDEGLLADVGFHAFNVSFDGFTKESFERIRRGANYDRIKKNILRGAKIARRSGAYTIVSATVLRSNMHETANLVRMWDAEGFDLVRLSIMRIRDPNNELLFGESLYPIRDELAAVLEDVARVVADERLRIGVRCGYYESPDFVAPPGSKVREATVSSENPSHRHVPGIRQDIQSGYWPGMSWPCKSPFVYARINWNGSVELCNKASFVIGNIYEQLFENIWRGAKASSQRQLIQGDRSICETCSYFRLCINIRYLDIYAAENYFAADILTHPKTTEFLQTLKGNPGTP